MCNMFNGSPAAAAEASMVNKDCGMSIETTNLIVDDSCDGESVGIAPRVTNIGNTQSKNKTFVHFQY